MFWKIAMIAVAPKQAETDGEHAGDATGAERDCQCRRHRAGLGSGGGAHVAARGQRHADEAGCAGRQAAEDERHGAPRAGLAEAERLGAIGLLDGRRGEEHDDRERNENDCDRLELAPQIRRGTLLDRLGDLLHLRSALVLRHDVPRQQHAHDDGDDCCNCGEYEHCPLAAFEDEVLVAAFSSNQ